MFASVLISLALLAQSAFAEIYVTSPVASTTWQAGQPQTISWQDDGQGVTLAQFGAAMVSLDVGNAIQQTALQVISQSVDVSTTSSIQFTPDPTVGGNGDDYFIRFQSLGLKDPSQPQYPALGFSAKFTMAGMTGSFNASVQAQIAGTSTAPIGGSVTAASTSAASSSASSPATTKAPATTGFVTSATGTHTSTSATHSGTASGNASNGASSVATSGAITFLGSIAAVFALML